MQCSTYLPHRVAQSRSSRSDATASPALTRGALSLGAMAVRLCTAEAGSSGAGRYMHGFREVKGSAAAGWISKAPGKLGKEAKGMDRPRWRCRTMFIGRLAYACNCNAKARRGCRGPRRLLHAVQWPWSMDMGAWSDDVSPFFISLLYSLGIYACLPLGKMLVRRSGRSVAGRGTCAVPES